MNNDIHRTNGQKIGLVFYSILSLNQEKSQANVSVELLTPHFDTIVKNVKA